MQGFLFLFIATVIKVSPYIFITCCSYKFVCSTQISLADLVFELIIIFSEEQLVWPLYIQKNLKLAAFYDEKDLCAVPKQPQL